MTNIKYPPIIYEICLKINPFAQVYSDLNFCFFLISIERLKLKSIRDKRHWADYVTDKKYAIYNKSPNELSINDGYFKDIIIYTPEYIEEKMGISPSKFLKKMYYGDVMRNKMLTTNTKIINKVLRKLPMIFPHRQDYLLFNPTIIHEWNKIIEQITQDI